MVSLRLTFLLSALPLSAHWLLFLRHMPHYAGGLRQFCHGIFIGLHLETQGKVCHCEILCFSFFPFLYFLMKKIASRNSSHLLLSRLSLRRSSLARVVSEAWPLAYPPLITGEEKMLRTGWTLRWETPFYKHHWTPFWEEIQKQEEDSVLGGHICPAPPRSTDWWIIYF